MYLQFQFEIGCSILSRQRMSQTRHLRSIVRTSKEYLELKVQSTRKYIPRPGWKHGQELGLWRMLGVFGELFWEFWEFLGDFAGRFFGYSMEIQFYINESSHQSSNFKRSWTFYLQIFWISNINDKFCTESKMKSSI